MTRRITSSDIARAAGVSQTTVSFVLNKTEGTSISAKTKARVLSAAEALGYVPNSAARTLVSGRSYTLGLLLARGDLMSFDAFAPSLMFGISRVCNLHGYKLLVEAVEPGSRRNAYFDLARSKSIDALIVLNSNSEDDGLVRLIESNFPVILFSSIHHPKENSVSPNTATAVEQVARHLVELGHRRIAHITYAPLRYIGASERLKAFQRALDREKVDFSDSWVGFGEFSIESGYRAMRMFAGNDTIALGAISALHDAGLSVPGDVAIVGFDDLPIAAYVSPKLTTVATQAIAQGEQAALAAIDLLKGQSVGKRNCNLSLELVVRQSCGAAKANRSLEERRLISQSNPKNLR